MKLKKIINYLKLQNLTPKLNTDIKIVGCYVSDIMSDTLANASEGDLWITQQSHQTIVALAPTLISTSKENLELKMFFPRSPNSLACLMANSILSTARGYSALT